MWMLLIPMAWASPTIDIEVERTVGLLDKAHLEKALRLRFHPDEG